MSTHSYSRLWIHLIWETVSREPMLDKRAAAKASVHLSDYAIEKGIYMKINYFNADHTHALIDLPTNKCIEEVVQLFKGDSSHWINENNLVLGRFAWGRGYGAFSVFTFRCAASGRVYCPSGRTPQKKTFAEEYELFVQTVRLGMARRGKPLKRLKS